MSANASLESALARAVEELDQASIPYMLIGGLALSAWALPRATLDIDLTLWVAGDDVDRVCLLLCASYLPRIADPVEFVRKTRVLPVATEGGVRLDFIFAAFPFEKAMVERAALRQLGGVGIRVATREDLILLKLPSPRDRDQEDVRLILHTYGRNLDWSYLLSVADALAESLDQPRIAAFLREHRATLGLGDSG
jgi:hypothetical protein